MAALFYLSNWGRVACLSDHHLLWGCCCWCCVHYFSPHVCSSVNSCSSSSFSLHTFFPHTSLAAKCRKYGGKALWMTAVYFTFWCGEGNFLLGVNVNVLLKRGLFTPAAQRVSPPFKRGLCLTGWFARKCKNNDIIFLDSFRPIFSFFFHQLSKLL